MQRGPWTKRTLVMSACGYRFDDRRFGARRNRGQHIFLTVDQSRGVVAGLLEAVAVGNGVGRTRLDAVPAENAAVIVDVVNAGVTLSAADSHLVGILGGFD